MTTFQLSTCLQRIRYEPFLEIMLPATLFTKTNLVRLLSSACQIGYIQATLAEAIFCEVEAEDPHNYLKGIYHPVKLGETFKDGRYSILHKLGWGSYATVWLAKDSLTNSNVALKITHKKTGTHELKIMRHLRDSEIAKVNFTHPGRRFVVQLLDDFEISVSHTCFVFDISGERIASYIDRSASGRLASLHANGLLIDLHGGNILFTAPTVSALAEEKLGQYLGKPEVGLICRLDGNAITESSMPTHLVMPKTFRGSGEEIRIVDWGAAFFHDSPPAKLHTPWHLRAPEALFDRPLSPYVDMWSLGCLLFETITGRPFHCPILADKSSALGEIQHWLGPPPKDWINLSKDLDPNGTNYPDRTVVNVNQYFRLAYNQEEIVIGEKDEDDYPDDKGEKAECDLAEDELDALSSMISSLLTYQPSLRGTPDTLLQSQWFRK